MFKVFRLLIWLSKSFFSPFTRFSMEIVWINDWTYGMVWEISGSVYTYPIFYFFLLKNKLLKSDLQLIKIMG